MTHKRNIVLFPGTLQNYQNTLTSLLETEQYDEALKLLQYLLQCEGEDEETYEEWELLLEWLTTHTKELKKEDRVYGEELDENRLLNDHIQTKLLKDEGYSQKLLEMLFHKSSPEKKWLALDQLVHIDDVEINQKIMEWLQNEKLNPMLQFKALQTLKQREAKGEITFDRLGEKVSVSIENTPIHFEDYPKVIVDVVDRVRHETEDFDQMISTFAEQTWKEYLSYIYGTRIYLESIELQNSNPFACALHKIALELTIGNIDEEQLLQTYGLSKNEMALMQKTYRNMKSYIETVLQTN
ncbi:HEAT repeat domain-containing protein [Chengkuizengella axinellae]|uniref:HEAT repeat domain-containing protein n=1 Tax=Chengkuizengella axinellae TaxID=3064388 RepID=A0ABT9ITI8_9BACL|nr:HEAT repeat domain-containing protein [Chengkuizengella sp. 2205SS18-9]MDP5272671.1 HEAT repeat domain-containing protein [Chengkuizengella sp. 2205SS18-9]